MNEIPSRNVLGRGPGLPILGEGGKATLSSARSRLNSRQGMPDGIALSPHRSVNLSLIR
jgi:hypothetical protein